MAKTSIIEVNTLSTRMYSLLAEHERRKIVTDLFKEFDTLTPQTRQLIEKLFQRTFKISGFTKFKNVPSVLRIDAVLQHSIKVPSFATVVLCGWFEQKHAIDQAIRDYATTYNKLVVWGVDLEVIKNVTPRQDAQIDASTSTGNDSSSIINLCQVDDRFLEMHPEMSRLDVIMAASCGAPIEIKEPHDIASESVSSLPDEILSEFATNQIVADKEVAMDTNDVAPWSNWLVEAESLPNEDPAWLQLDHFITALRRLAEVKSQIAVEEKRLQSALTRLQSVVPEVLDEMFLSPILLWQFPQLLPTHVVPVIAQLEALLTKITEYQEVQSAPEKNRQDRGEKRQRLSELEADAEALLTQLQPFFGPTTTATSTPTHLPNSLIGPLTTATEALSPVDGGQPSPMSVAQDIDTLDTLDTLASNDIANGLETYDQDDKEVEPLALLDPLTEEFTEDILNEVERVEANFELNNEVKQPIDQAPLDTLSTDLLNVTSTNETTSSRDDNEHLWKMVEVGDLAGAYWLSQSMLKLNKVPAIPPDLLAAAQGSAWLMTETKFSYAEDLREIARRYQPDPTRLEHLLLGVAAALPAIILSPSSELLDWLNVGTEYLWLAEFATPIREFGFYGVGLSSNVLPGVTDAAQLEEQLRQVVAHANEWWTMASHRRSHLKRAVDVWHSLIKPQGRLSRFLQPVLTNEALAIEIVCQELIHWQTPSYVATMIDDVDRELSEGKKPRIDGGIRDYLRRGIAEACQHASNWIRLTKELNKRASQGNDWLAQQATKLRNHLKDSLPGVFVILDELHGEMQPLSQRSAAQVLRCTLQDVSRIFGIDLQVIHQTPAQLLAEWANAPYLQWAMRDTDGIAQALNRRLLLLPTIRLEDDGSPSHQAWSLVFESIEVSLPLLPDLFAHWLERQDYRFADLLLELHPDRQKAVESLESNEEGSRLALEDQLHNVLAKIEQAVVDGIISDLQRAEYLVILDMIYPADVRNFEAESERLANLEREIKKAYSARMAHLNQQWIELHDALLNSFVGEEKQKIVADFFTTAMAKQDTRLVEESLAHLREALETHQDTKIENWFAPRDEGDTFQQFLNRMVEVAKSLDGSRTLRDVQTTLKESRTFAGLEFGGVPIKRREEALSALVAWAKLKQGLPKASYMTQVRTSVGEILTYLGLALTPNGVVMADGMSRDNGTEYVVLNATFTPGDLARPIPQFGSQAKGQYRIICFWERPSIDTIVARLTENNLTTMPVIAFYLGRLTNSQRRDLVESTRANRLSLAVLDETLLVYLAASHTARFPIFLRCALPYATLSPYALQAGNVPPEVFYGRQEAIKQLSEQQGSCIVYGGRQLGKSALLRQVQRSFHHPESGAYAFFIDIKNIGDPLVELKTEELWSKIRESLREQGLLKKQHTTARPSEIVKLITNLLNERPQMHLLFLLDEADHFLDADAKANFPEVERLRELMGDTDRRFRIVFAGLHNVQRFQGIPNQPLAHFGDPLCVGPLEAKAALDLVREPLSVLGFHFADDSVALRLLSYTNYHPSLIQLFCQELLQRLHRRYETKAPPYEINQNDVEGVYRHPEVRQRIRERFDWTLALDTRYQVIAYALVENQLETQNSYEASYTVPEVQKLVQFWWQNGFKDVDQSRLQGLLDEMVGLGILVRKTEGSYRLRSPNLVRLMGSAEAIETRLLELSARSAPAEYSADHYHALLNDAIQQYSPLSYAQERSVTRHQSGVTLLFASEAQGLSDLPKALQRFGRMVGDVTSHAVQEIPSTIIYPDLLKSHLSSLWNEHGAAEQIFAYYLVKPHDALDCYQLVEMAMQYCASLRSQKRSFQVVFIFGHEAAWQWLVKNPQRSQNLERAATILSPLQWEIPAIRQRLEQQSKLDSEEVCERVLVATGGWPKLLNVLMMRCQHEQDLREPANALAKELALSKTIQFSEFRTSLGLEKGQPPTTLLNFAVELLHNSQESIEAEFLTFAYNEPELALLAHECHAAIEYLVRMGCLRRHGNQFTLSPLIYQMLKQS